MLKAYKKRAVDEEREMATKIDLFNESPENKRFHVDGILKVINPREFKSRKEYLNAVIQNQIKLNDNQSFGTSIFKDVKMEYYTKLLSEFRHDYVKTAKFIPTVKFTGNTTRIEPDKNRPTVEEFIKKHQIEEKKRELIKQIEDLRLNKGLLKHEYEEKLNSLKEKWKQIEQTPLKDELPVKEELEEIVGIVDKKFQVTTLHTRIIAENTPEAKKANEEKAA